MNSIGINSKENIDSINNDNNNYINNNNNSSNNSGLYLNDKNYWINKLNLTKHIEGGYFRQVTNSSDDYVVKDKEGNTTKRSFFTSIYYLLDTDKKSHLHRIKCDEVWYYQFGASLIVHCILPSGVYERILIGPDGYLQYNVKKGTIFCSELYNNYKSIESSNSSPKSFKKINSNNNNNYSFSIVACMVSPGFLFEEFELFTKQQLINIYPQHKELIQKFAYDKLPTLNIK